MLHSEFANIKVGDVIVANGNLREKGQRGTIIKILIPYSPGSARTLALVRFDNGKERRLRHWAINFVRKEE